MAKIFNAEDAENFAKRTIKIEVAENLIVFDFNDSEYEKNVGKISGDKTVETRHCLVSAISIITMNSIYSSYSFRISFTISGETRP